RPSQPGLHPLHDEVALQFCDGADDHHHRPTQRPARVELLAEAHEVDAQVVQLVQHLEKVGDGARQPVAGPHHEHLELPTPSVRQELIQAGTGGSGAAAAVLIHLDRLETARLRQGLQVVQLGLRMLVEGRDAYVEHCSLHGFLLGLPFLRPSTLESLPRRAASPVQNPWAGFRNPTKALGFTGILQRFQGTTPKSSTEKALTPTPMLRPGSSDAALSPSLPAGWGLVVKLWGNVAGRTKRVTGRGKELEKPRSLRSSHPDLPGWEPRPTAAFCLRRRGPEGALSCAS